MCRCMMAKPKLHDEADEYTDLEEGLDILAIKDSSIQSDLYSVTFSFYTASPTCMILPKNLSCFPNDVGNFNEAQRNELFRVAKDFAAVFVPTDTGINLVLSIHRKGWVSRKNRFHAHICFGEDGKERYLEIFDEIKQYPPMSEFWPSEAPERFVRKCWPMDHESEIPCPENIDRLHAQCVRDWPTFTWKNTDLWDVKALRNVAAQVIFVSGFDLVFHEEQPMVGLSWAGPWTLDTENQSTKYHLEEYLRQLDRLVEYLVGNVEECDGANLCISVHGHGFPGFGVDDVLGYIHVSGPTFYRICPADKREDWWSNYSKWDGKVYT